MNLTEAAMSFKVNNTNSNSNGNNNESQPQEDEDIITRLHNLGSASNLYDSLKTIVQGGEFKPASVIDLVLVDPGTPDEQKAETSKSEVKNTTGMLFLLPGSMDIAEFDEHISVGMSASPDSTSASSMNIPGAFYDLISKTAKAHKFDFVLVDVSPAVGHLNRNILFSSHLFLMPCRCDAFSKQAVRVLTGKLPGWHRTFADFRERTRPLSWI